MYSNPWIRWSLLPLFVISILPIAAIFFFPPDDPLYQIVVPAVLWNVLSGAVIVSGLMFILLKVLGVQTFPLWITLVAAAILFSVSVELSGLFGPFWFIALFGFSIASGKFYFELDWLEGCYVGLCFVLARYAAGMVALVGTMGG